MMLGESPSFHCPLDILIVIISRQLCGQYGAHNYTYHDENGVPVVDLNLFPDFNKMTDYAHSLGLTAG
jgi:hypothetical protein